MGDDQNQRIVIQADASYRKKIRDDWSLEHHRNDHCDHENTCGKEFFFR